MRNMRTTKSTKGTNTKHAKSIFRTYSYFVNFVLFVVRMFYASSYLRPYILILLTSLFLPRLVSAQTQCCASPSNGPPYTSCLVEKLDVPCITTPPKIYSDDEAERLCEKPQQRYAIMTEIYGKYNAIIIDAVTCEITLQKRRPTPHARVVCGDGGVKCIEALRLETDCSLFDSSSNDCLDSASGRNCFHYAGKCYNRSDPQICTQIIDEKYCGTDQAQGRIIGSTVCQWIPPQNGQLGRCGTRVEGDISDRYGGGGAGLLTPCAVAGNCRSINDLIYLLIKRGAGLFPWLGIMAFAMFIYGGVTVILSFGNPEKVQHGKKILTAAVVGIIIAFGAYALVLFILEGLNVGATFRTI